MHLNSDLSGLHVSIVSVKRSSMLTDAPACRETAVPEMLLFVSLSTSPILFLVLQPVELSFY